MKFIFSIFLLCACYHSKGQVFTKDSVNFYLARLRNEAVSETHNTFTTAGMNPDATAVFLHASTTVADTLIDLLADKNKTLACHVLLTLWMEPAHKTVYHNSEDLTETILISYQFNGFAWKAEYDKTNLNTEIKIEPAEIKKIQTYWLPKKGKFNCALPAQQ